ncbi:MAG TPA: AAA family ATPase [Ruminococcus flavefaciens]|mgnify:CR=1 FL=1|nr:AAA family ATPase [Ruminococcus flavefaciens]
MKLDIKTIKFTNHKSFQNGFHSISDLKNVNVFIGRNNCGKSSCIDIFQALTDANNFKEINANIKIGKELSYSDLERVFPLSIYKDHNYKTYEEILQAYENKYIEFYVSKYKENALDFNTIITSENGINASNNWENVGKDLRDMFSKLTCIRLNAERDITLEQEVKEVSLSENGIGATNLIHHILHFDKYAERLVRIDLLEALNEIMYPDSKFDGITVQKVSDEKWEIFLYENDNRYPLSKIGSGLKTIILVLLNLLVVPCISGNITISREDVDYEKYIFAFEELENNLHPALQRRLFGYIYEFSKDHNTMVLLTTHSHVAINMFADKDETQLYHVVKENGKSSIVNVGDYITKSMILNDLDVRAGDLLQSNGIIWVEGPSDKVYIKHWLEIWGDEDLVDGVDYQFLYYGGRILSHFTAKPDSKDDNLINILTTNRNAVIVIDSDICGKKKGINVTKTRIKKEFEEVKMFCWITKGKEIENYVPVEAINKAYADKTIENQCEQYQFFPDYIKEKLNINNFDKVAFAHTVVKHINDENSKDILDLKERVIELCKIIKLWNPKC